MSNIKIISQHIKSLSFEVPNAPQVFLNPQDKPDILLSINIDAKKLAEDTFEIALKISANATAKEQKLFDCELTYAGIFALPKVEGEMLEQILLIYCPNLLFPFLRRIIANTTSDAGFSPLMLDVIDFADLYAKRKASVNAAPISNVKN